MNEREKEIYLYIYQPALSPRSTKRQKYNNKRESRETATMATFYKFGKLWEIPPAAARLGRDLPANTRAFETFLTDLEPMLSEFICAHPLCPPNPDLAALREALKEFMEEQAPSNFTKERWAASYDPARKVTYVSWFLATVAYFLDKADFRPSTSPSIKTASPNEAKPLRVILEPPVSSVAPPKWPAVPPPQGNPTPRILSSRPSSSRPSSSSISSPSPASLHLPNPLNPFAPATKPPAAPATTPLAQPTVKSTFKPTVKPTATPVARPARQSRLWNAGGPPGLAALEQRDAERREAEQREAQTKQPQHCPQETLEVIVIQIRDE
jgi:hypothetical protein